MLGLTQPSPPSLLLQSLDPSPRRDGDRPAWGCHQGKHFLPFSIPARGWLLPAWPLAGGRQSQPWQNSTGSQWVKCCLESSGKTCLCHGSEQLLWLLLQNKQWVFKNTSFHIENENQLGEISAWGELGCREQTSPCWAAHGVPGAHGCVWREETDA